MSTTKDSVSSLGESTAAVREISGLEPRVGIVLGTGRGGLIEEIEVEATIPCEELPGFPRPMPGDSSGRLIIGRLGETPVVALQRTCDRHVGHCLREVTFPVRVLGALGTGTLVVQSPSVAVNPQWRVGELVLVTDHINLLGDSPLVGPNPNELGPRFPDMSQAYDAPLQSLATKAAADLGIRLHRGVYVAVPDPALGTRAERRMLRSLGADIVGGSMVPEVIVARHMDVRVLGLSVITEIPAEAPQSTPDLTRLMVSLVRQL